MRRLGAASVLVGALMIMSVGSATAAIHPIVGSFCATVAGTNPKVLDPPGQTPTSQNPNDWKVSHLRALLATGFITWIRDSNGTIIGFSVDPTLPAVKDGSFPAFVNCRNLNP